MKTTKPIVLLFSSLMSMVVIVPSLLVLPYHAKMKEPKESKVAVTKGASMASRVEVAVYRSQQQKIEHVQIEDYVCGVVSAEMPATFEIEALKAQALTARTFVVKRMLGGLLPNKANVTDTVDNQVYKNDEELKQLWGVAYEMKIKRVREAVMSTAGQVLTYQGEPITAFFFSMSNGRTENAEDYWGSPYPYLRSVDSPWDQAAPKYTAEQSFTVAEFQKRLGVQVVGDGTVGKIVDRTAGQRVKTVSFGGKTMSGKEVREKLGIRSTDFSWKQQGNMITIQTKGYGHGVGMSQYGANGMAQEGKTYKDIVNHYYQGVDITALTQYEGRFTAKK